MTAPLDPTATPLTDEELMLATAKGDEGAFEALVKRHQAPLLRFFVRMGADRSFAEDCTQEVLVRVFRARERYEPRAKFTTWLYRIGKNHWIDQVRSRAAQPRALSLDAPVAGAEETPLRDAVPEGANARMGQELNEEIERAVATLPEEQRMVLVLGMIQALPYAEVSVILDIPVGTVKSRMHAAVGRLREVLDGRVN
jgi:RNA polymerase sigma-70 factor, ECF subfamily